MFYVALLVPLLSAAPAVEQRGLVNVTEQEIPVPPGTQSIPIEGGDLEGPQWRGGWTRSGTTLVEAPDAPQGKGYARMEQKAGSAVFFPIVRLVPGVQQYYLSFALRLKTPAPLWSMIGLDGSERPQTFGSSFPELPSTEGRWRRVGLYVWAPLQAETLRFAFRIDEATAAAGQFVDFDDVRLRTATPQELAKAYAAQRRHYPDYDALPRPGDGRNLALSVTKWKGRGLPGKPFVIWAVGSSWTNSQRDGYPLLLAIRQRFPQAPTLIYKKRAGSGTPWDFARGWLRQYILADNPDLILTYTNGDPDKLDDMLASIRARSTADIIVPSLHYFQKTELSEKERDQGVVDWAKVRAVCRKHGAEFVENRAELYDYLKRIGQPPAVMVGDPVHQNEHGYIRIWDNITRHVADPGAFSYDPQDRERTLTPDGKGGRDGEGFRTEGDRVKIRFRGNRIDLAAAGPLRAQITLDGIAGETYPAYVMTYIQPGAKNTLILKGPGPGDVAPHEVELLSQVVPQTWTITMVDDAGDYELSGSVTGPDGRGHVLTAFTSRSGQVRLDPALWRHIDKNPKTGKVTYPNAKGDTFTFDVRRAVDAQIQVQPRGAAAVAICVARQLRNTWHELTLTGEGLANVLAVRIAEPPDQRQ
jgi:hypothetical protein